MASEKEQDSVKRLADLYTVIIGVSLSLAVNTVFSPGLSHLSISSCFLLIAFLVTLIPFYHGAIRHLYDSYILNNNTSNNTSVLLFDFLLLILHGIVFIILSTLISMPSEFVWVLLSIFIIDIVWGIFVSHGNNSGQEKSTESKWATINFIFVVISIAYMALAHIGIKSNDNSYTLSVLIALACLVRSFADYSWCYEFYFPRDSQ